MILSIKIILMRYESSIFIIKEQLKMKPSNNKIKKDDSGQISGLLKNISHFKSVIRKFDIISEETERIIYQNDATIRALGGENNKKLKTLQQQMNKLSTEEKLDKALEILFTNFDIVNRSMETKSLLISDINEYLKRTRNTIFSLLKSTELLLEKEG